MLTNKITEGNIEKSNASFIFMAVNNISSEIVILMIIKKLSSHVGRGITSIATIKITTANTPRSRNFNVFPPLIY